MFPSKIRQNVLPKRVPKQDSFPDPHFFDFSALGTVSGHLKNTCSAIFEILGVPIWTPFFSKIAKNGATLIGGIGSGADSSPNRVLGVPRTLQDSPLTLSPADFRGSFGCFLAGFAHRFLQVSGLIFHLVADGFQLFEDGLVGCRASRIQ